MAVYELKGEAASIKVAGMGAELQSYVNLATGQEYMWSGDPAFWGRVSPVLFPLVGRLNGKKYTYKGKTYYPPVHGFARDTEFELLEKTENSMRFGIHDTESTREVYPFSFSFEILYELLGKNLKVTFFVRNKGEEPMYFALGAHPGFVCPKEKGGRRADCYLGFGGADSIVSREVDMNTGLVTDHYEEYTLEEGLLPITDDMFDKDALVLEGGQIHEVSLHGADGKPYVTLEMNAPVYGIWSCVTPGAPFICIEPWYGRCDALGFEGDFEEREYQNKLEAGEEFVTSYTVKTE